MILEFESYPLFFIHSYFLMHIEKPEMRLTPSSSPTYAIVILQKVKCRVCH